MSGQWEVVGRNKKDKLALTNKKNVKPEKKTTNVTKVEDVLPSSQVKNLYMTNGKSNKENKKPQEKDKPKENAKKPAQKKNEKSQETAKVKTYKSIESALNSIQANDIKAALETSMQKFPDAPLVWLKEVASILNNKIIVDLPDPTFANRSDWYPLTAIPAGIKQVMEKAVESAGKSTAQLFFDITLTAMAHDLTKNHPAIGHKLWIQFLAFNNPQITLINTEKFTQLRTSYQNRQAIGLSILWALGQGGIKDFNTGLKVFKDFMMPLLEMKNYSKYIVQYLSQLLKHHENVSLSKDNFTYLFELCHTKHNLPNDLAQQLSGLSKNLLTMVSSKSSDKKCSLYFEPLLARLVNSVTNATKNDICNALVTFLSKDTNCYNTWLQLYMKNLQQSNNLLKYIHEHWKKVSPMLDVKKLRETVKTFSTTNTELSTNTKKDPALKDATSVCKVLLEKMTVSKSWIPWKTLIFLFFLSTISFLVYDLRRHDHWQKSQSVRTLKELGIWEYGEKTWDRANQGLNWTKQRIEAYAPGYIDYASEFVQPYFDVTRDVGLVLYNLGENYRELFDERYPEIIEYIEKQAPGLLYTLENMYKGVIRRSSEIYNQVYGFITTQVFVGPLAPENMQKFVMGALNTTTVYATEYYHWLYEKIETTVNGK